MKEDYSRTDLARRRRNGHSFLKKISTGENFFQWMPVVPAQQSWTKHSKLHLHTPSWSKLMTALMSISSTNLTYKPALNHETIIYYVIGLVLYVHVFMQDVTPAKTH